MATRGSTTTSRKKTAAFATVACAALLGLLLGLAVPWSGSGSSSLMTHYRLSPIAIGFFLIYLGSFVLYKTDRMRVATHRKIWNVLLLATFLITGVFGLLLVIRLEYGLPFTVPFDLLFWHVEAGIVMTLISLFHLGWHFNYYRNLLRSGRREARATREAERARAGEGPYAVRGAPGVVVRSTTVEPQQQAMKPRPWAEPEAE